MSTFPPASSRSRRGRAGESSLARISVRGESSLAGISVRGDSGQAGISGLLGLDVEADERVLVSDVELAAGDGGVSPDVLGGAIGRGEAALLLVGGGAGLDEGDGAALASAVEVA